MRNNLIPGAAAAVLTLALSALPVVPDLAEGGLAGVAAHAKGQGGGNGGGPGGGNGGGNGNAGGNGQGHGSAAAGGIGRPGAVGLPVASINTHSLYLGI